MMEFGIYLILVFFILLLAGCAKQKACDSGMRMLNADWLDEAEKFKLIARCGRL